MAPNPSTRRSSKSPIDLWAGFLDHEKLGPDRASENVMVMVKLCEELAKDHPEPYFFRSHKDRLVHRRYLVVKAMDLGIDLPAIKHRGKVAMGRGLLDIWNEEYAKRYGSTVGTVSRHEVVRRTVVTKLSQQRRKEEQMTKTKKSEVETPVINNQLVTKQWLYATTKVPGSVEFIQLIKDLFKDVGEVLAMKGCEGPGCYNLAIKVQGPDPEALEKLARELAMALQPGKYCDNKETIEGFDVLLVADVDAIKTIRDAYQNGAEDPAMIGNSVFDMLQRQSVKVVAEALNRTEQWVNDVVKGIVK